MKNLSFALPGAVTGILVLAAATSPAHAAERTLDLTSVPTAITQPGTYVARRDWQLDWGTNSSAGIVVTADDVVIDLRGFTINGVSRGMVIKVKGNNVTVRGGQLNSSAQDGSYAIRSSGVATHVEDMHIYSLDGVILLGSNAVVRNSVLNGKFDLVHVGAEALVEGNGISGTNFPLTLEGDRSVAVRNRISGGSGAVNIRGNQNLFSDNVVSAVIDFDNGITVDGSYNTLARNTMYPQFGTMISINGTANTIEGTIAPPTADSEGPSNRGIVFLASGNFFGNNRLWAEVPYELNGTQQTDWGGNVSY
ncbi:MAG TPA: hypothetical protein VFX89_21610 [Gammaproteobacteria bacterium]|nr:hypothetical protein [Gammaproteobacteria bacterium]